MAKVKEKKPVKGKGESLKEPGCDLDDLHPPAPSAGGLAGALGSIRRSRSLQVVLALTIIGAFLRLFQLGSASLWLDEATTLTSAGKSLFEIWNFLSMSEFTPPLFFWMEHAMLTLGDSETVLRLVPALFGIFTIPVFYLIGAELLDRKTGILAAALLTFSPFALYYSQEARAYSTMLFFLSAAFYFFLRTQRTGAWRDALLFGIFSSIALWTHLFASVPVAALIVFGFGMKGKEILRDARAALPLAISVMAFVLLSLPLLLSALPIFTTLTGRGPTFGIQGFGIIFLTLTQISGFSLILSWVFMLLFIIGIASLYPVSRWKALVLSFVLVFTLAVSVFLSYRMSMVPRYLTSLLMVVLPGVALTIRPACKLFPSRKLVYGAIVLVVLINLPVLYGYYSTPQKDDWRGLAQEVTTVAVPGDLVVAIPGYIHQPLNYYYQNKTHGTLEFGLYTVTEVEGVIGANPGRTVWFVVTGDVQSIDPEGRMMAWLGEHSRLVWRDRNGGIFLLKYSG